MSPNVEFAKLYRRRYKWSVIPSDGKFPKIKWKQYQTELPSIEQIEQWWAEYPKADISLVTGRLSGIVIFDADGQKALDYLEDRGMPYTPEVQSSSKDRRHFYFEYPELEGRIITCVSKSVHKVDLEVKAEGGLTVLPPSIHNSGVKYKWIHSPEEYSPAEMDMWHMEFCLNHKKKKFDDYGAIDYSRIPGWAEELLANGAKVGERDISTYKLARTFCKRGFEKTNTIQKLIQWNRDKNEKGGYPYFTDNHVKKCVRSAYGKR